MTIRTPVLLLALCASSAPACSQPVSNHAGASGSDNNPDGYPTTGTVFYANNYDAKNPRDILDQPFTTETWSPSQGRAGSGAWKIAIGEYQPGDEDNVGYSTTANRAMPVYPAAGGTRRLFVSHTLTASAAMTELLRTGNIMKWVDIWQYAADGSQPDAGRGGSPNSDWAVTGNTRFVSFLGRARDAAPAQHVRFSATPGGAGPFYSDDGVNRPVNFDDFLASGFVWVGFVLSEGDTDAETYMRLYYKRCGMGTVTKFLERNASVITRNPPDPDQFFGSNGRGWAAGDKSLGGYLNTARAAGDGSEWWILDDQTIADHWVGPPAGC